jgi:PAS domain S-box-containing protein
MNSETVIREKESREPSTPEEADRLNRVLRARLDELELENARLKGALKRSGDLPAGNTAGHELSSADIALTACGGGRLQPNRRLFQTIIDSVGDLIYVKNRDGAYLACNAASEKFIGLSESEQIGKTDFDFFGREIAEIIREKDRQILATGLEHQVEEWVTYPDGTRRLLDTKKAPFYGPDGEIAGIVGISRDITELENIQYERLRSQKLESLGVLAGGIAHDFNNILTAIVGNISFAKRLVSGSDDARIALERAEKASMRAADLARQLLTFAKGGQPIKKLVSLQKVLREAVSLALSGTNVKGVIDIPSPLHTIKADESQINQAVHNIIINAVHAMPGGGILTVHGENAILDADSHCGLSAGTYLKLSFRDEGCGIPEGDLKKIFDPYFTTKAGGTGLGLASSYSIIKKHGGHISVSSTVGSGTVFTIFLPSTGDTAPAQGTESASVSVDEGECSLLVMDDEEMIRELAAMTLGRIGYTVKACENGNEAIALYKAAKEAGKPFSVVIMDLTIPGGMGGVEAARGILAFDPAAHLVVSSGYFEDPVVANYREYGFCAAIEKPYKIEDISRILKEVVLT